jgi:hypothetical protein
LCELAGQKHELFERHGFLRGTQIMAALGSSKVNSCNCLLTAVKKRQL